MSTLKIYPRSCNALQNKLFFLTENCNRQAVGHNLWLNLWSIFENCGRNIFSQISLTFLTENYDRYTVGHYLWPNLWLIFKNFDRNIIFRPSQFSCEDFFDWKYPSENRSKIFVTEFLVKISIRKFFNWMSVGHKLRSQNEFRPRVFRSTISVTITIHKFGRNFQKNRWESQSQNITFAIVVL